MDEVNEQVRALWDAIEVLGSRVGKLGTRVDQLLERTQRATQNLEDKLGGELYDVRRELERMERNSR